MIDSRAVLRMHLAADAGDPAGDSKQREIDALSPATYVVPGAER